MPKGQKKIVLHEAVTHEVLFADNYELLHRWALQFTEGDRELAEDLLHDAFIHFTIARPDLSSIENLEGYLYLLMRNLHLSQLRKATRTPLRAMSVVEFDTVDVGTWASDPRDRLRMREELAAVCQYACIRKETSKGGSVLILRFFHGYYPEEIAHVLRSTRAVVHERLRRVRAEVRAYLDDPSRLSFIGETHKPAKLKSPELGGDLRLELVRAIFDSCQGDHTTPDILRETYQAERGDGLECRPLAHIVSCRPCLEKVNSLLGLPPLASRYPLDTLGKDPGPKDRSGGEGGSGSGPGGSKVLETFINRRDAHYHHEPQELCISVNGQLQGFQKVVSGRGELTLILDTIDTIGFVEVFSEQGLRLLLLNVEAPPVGDGKQSAHVELSSGRTVDANLNYSGPFPALQVTYNDPALAAAAAEIPEVPSVSPVALDKEKGVVPITWWPGLGSLWDGFRLWLQPARLTTAFATLLIAALLFFKFAPTTTVSAARLLEESAESEAARLSNKERVLHRTLDLEESGPGGERTHRKRIDVWHSAERGMTVRRVYDEDGRLMMGDWRRKDGVQTIYRPGETARLQPLADKRTITFEDAWQLSLTAREFTALIHETDKARLEERANDYLITYEAAAVGNSNGIIKAAITLSREDLHAIEQTFTLWSAGETREFRMVEAGYDWRPSNTVAPAVFEPNVELTEEVGPEVSATNPVTDTGTGPLQPNVNTAPTASLATAALEVEVIEALNGAGAFMGELVSVSRTYEGKIQVSALVETAERKKALLGALGSFASNPAVRVSVETVAEAEARAKRQTSSRGEERVELGTIQQIDVTEGKSAVYAELRKKFSDDEARRFADRVLNRSRQARQHALAMKQLSGRFSEADLETLTPDERGRWLALIRGHAESFVREAESLRRELQQFFPEATAGPSGGQAINSDAELQTRAGELYDAAVLLDRGLGQSLALTAGQSVTAPVTSPGFWQSFRNAVSIARSLAAAK